jgi:hypothetical protein
MKYLKLRLWIQVLVVATAISVSPLVAQDISHPIADNKTQQDFGNSQVGSVILSVLPKKAVPVNAAFPTDGKNAEKTTSPGKTYGPLIAIVAVAGGIVAASLLLVGGGSKPGTSSTSSTAPVNTSVTAGSPVITPPASH